MRFGRCAGSEIQTSPWVACRRADLAVCPGRRQPGPPTLAAAGLARSPARSELAGARGYRRLASGGALEPWHRKLAEPRGAPDADRHVCHFSAVSSARCRRSTPALPRADGLRSPTGSGWLWRAPPVIPGWPGERRAMRPRPAAARQQERRSAAFQELNAQFSRPYQNGARAAPRRTRGGTARSRSRPTAGRRGDAADTLTPLRPRTRGRSAGLRLWH